MKLLPRFTILIMGLFIALFVPLFTYTRLDAEAAALNTRVNDVMVTAAYDAMQTVRPYNGKLFELDSQKRNALDAFYRSLSMGYFKANIGENDPLLESFIPFVMLVDDDGIYICYNRDYYNWDDTEYLPYYITPQYRFTENYFNGSTQYTIDYCLSDHLTVYKDGRLLASGSYIYVRKFLMHEESAIFTCCDFLKNEDGEDGYTMEKKRVVTSSAQRLVEKYLNWELNIYKENSTDPYETTNESGYNRHGRQHSFTIPIESNEDWQRALMGPTIMAFYEGVQTDVLNNYVAQVAFSGGELVKENKYYIAGGNYHLPTCSHINESNLNTAYSSFNSMEEAARAGYFPCQECIH